MSTFEPVERETHLFHELALLGEGASQEIRGLAGRLGGGARGLGGGAGVLCGGTLQLSAITDGLLRGPERVEAGAIGLGGGALGFGPGALRLMDLAEGFAGPGDLGFDGALLVCGAIGHSAS
jgi:hypothetical protein